MNSSDPSPYEMMFAAKQRAEAWKIIFLFLFILSIVIASVIAMQESARRAKEPLSAAELSHIFGRNTQDAEPEDPCRNLRWELQYAAYLETLKEGKP